VSVPYVLFVVTNAAVIGPNNRPTGFFFPEIAHPFEALDRARVAVEFASPLGGKPPEDGFDADDPAQTTPSSTVRPTGACPAAAN
jgi:putative intracellular protease/amidase